MDPCNPLPPVDEELDLPRLSRVQQIIVNARRTLADPQKQRWSDKTLLCYLNEGLVDFCSRTRILRKKATITLTSHEALFDLPKDCWQVLRVSYKNRVLPIVTREELDTKPLPNYLAAWRPGPNWADNSGKPLAVLFDMIAFNKGELYPTPTPEEEEIIEVDKKPFGFILVETRHTFAELLPSVFGVLENGEDDFGVVTSLNEGELFQDFGILSFVLAEGGYEQSNIGGIVDMESAQEFGLVDEFVEGVTDTPVFGIVNSLTDVTTTITPEVPMKLQIYYLKTPRKIRRYKQKMETPALYDRALEYFVVGKAFMSDIDTASQQKAAQQLGLYTGIIEGIQKDTSMNWSRRGSFTIGYRRGV